MVFEEANNKNTDLNETNKALTTEWIYQTIDSQIFRMRQNNHEPLGLQQQDLNPSAC